MYDTPPADNDRETHTGLSHDLILPVTMLLPLCNQPAPSTPDY